MLVMIRKYRVYLFAIVCIIASGLLFTQCANKTVQQDAVLFELLEAEQTGIRFSNVLTPKPDFNMFTYMYFYNGAGVGAGDFNQDGLVDLFFAANQQPNALYLNKGKLQFEDISKQAGIPRDSAWSTGVSVVDINNDGLLDIYVCRVGNYETLKSYNQLLVCTGIRNGIPQFEEQSKQYGLDFSGFSTQAAFLDYDLDGDLDMFLLNHSVHQNGTFGPRSQFLGTYHPLSGDRLFRNEGRKFTDVTKQCGIESSAISYGLGVAVADINLDGWPDIYVGNDFHENDYLYINDRNGRFHDASGDMLMHTSQYSMGVDVADINNDAYPEIISADMLPQDPYILKRSLGEDAYDLFNMKIRIGYQHQYTRNNLQLNRKNGLFSEVGRYSNVFATDWSWSTLFMDFDNDGRKDLFISNGIPKRLNDIDYVNFVSNEELQSRIRSNAVTDKDFALINRYPEIKIPNKFYLNKGNAAFDDIAPRIQNDKPTFSNGAVYADLDNDGDLDLVVNNIADPVMIYQNKLNDQQSTQYLSLTLKGNKNNINAIGVQILVYQQNETRTYANYAVKGFQSSMQLPMLIGMQGVKPDSILLIWPDQTYQRINWKGEKQLAFSWQKGLPRFDFARLDAKPSPIAEDITADTKLLYTHTENDFVEFDREPLMPHMVSREGPALAVADINQDGLEDVFIGSPKTSIAAVFLQNAAGRFTQLKQPALLADSAYEEVAAVWVDVNGDRYPDLITASGGNEFFGNDSHQQPRSYLNDGKGNLRVQADAFNNVYLTASCIAVEDMNKDGFPDLFIGARAVPWEYGARPKSYLLLNDGRGRFKEITATMAPALADAGFVTGAIWTDINGDKQNELVVSTEWGGIDAYMKKGEVYAPQPLITQKGWWQFVSAADIDGDGDQDFIAGNLGWNTRLKASEAQPVRMYYNDFDGNGKKEQILTYYLGGKEIPFANKAEFDKKLPSLKKQFLFAEDFAKASLEQLLPADKLGNAAVYEANWMANSLLINDGKGKFTIQAMPWEAQLSPFRTVFAEKAQLILAGNFYENNVEMGRYDADFGTLLQWRNQQWVASALPGFVIKGQVRQLQPITIKGEKALIAVRNNAPLMVVRLRNQ